MAELRGRDPVAERARRANAQHKSANPGGHPGKLTEEEKSARSKKASAINLKRKAAIQEEKQKARDECTVHEIVLPLVPDGKNYEETFPDSQDLGRSVTCVRAKDGRRVLLGPLWGLKAGLWGYSAFLHDEGLKEAEEELDSIVACPESWDHADADVFPERHDGACRWPGCRATYGSDKPKLYSHETFCGLRPLLGIPEPPKKWREEWPAAVRRLRKARRRPRRWRTITPPRAMLAASSRPTLAR
jgi:hypothetical protein